MYKERDKLNNGSYFFRLNQELSGQEELIPYYALSDENANVTEEYNTNTPQDGQITGELEEESIEN